MAKVFTPSSSSSSWRRGASVLRCLWPRVKQVVTGEASKKGSSNLGWGEMGQEREAVKGVGLAESESRPSDSLTPSTRPSRK